MVVTSAPSFMTASVRQEMMRRPSTSTVQAPHWPWSQPFLVPVRSRWSRSASSKRRPRGNGELGLNAVDGQRDRHLFRGRDRARPAAALRLRLAPLAVSAVEEVRLSGFGSVAKGPFDLREPRQSGAAGSRRDEPCDRQRLAQVRQQLNSRPVGGSDAAPAAAIREGAPFRLGKQHRLGTGQSRGRNTVILAMLPLPGQPAALVLIIAPDLMSPRMVWNVPDFNSVMTAARSRRPARSIACCSIWSEA